MRNVESSVMENIFRYVRRHSTQLIGTEGEHIAAEYLRTIGYDIRGCNIKIGRDEIDILALDPVDQVLVFAEVKSRAKKSDDYRPDISMDRRKMRALRRAARLWVAKQDYEGGYRLDLICVVDGKITDHWKQLSWE